MEIFLSVLGAMFVLCVITVGAAGAMIILCWVQDVARWVNKRVGRQLHD
jgi:hypothetical protein